MNSYLQTRLVLHYGFEFFRPYLSRAFSASAFLILLFLAPLYGDEKALTHSQIAEANKPGTIMIFTQWTSKIGVGREGFKFDALGQYAQKQIKLGLLPRNPNVVFKAMFDELLNHPDAYMVPTNDVLTLNVHAAATGSGFIVTPDGYIVTNAHVVYDDPNDLKLQIVLDWESNELEKLFEADFEAFKKEFEPYAAVGPQAIEDRKQDFITAEKKYYFRNMQVLNTKTDVYALMGIAVPGLPTQPHGTPCDIRKVGEPVTGNGSGKDVAILKIEQNNLPTVPVGDDSTMRVGETIIVLGYPGAAEINRQQMGVESTLTQGDLSARKTMPGGWQALQTSAEINHGNSGGPAFNDRGQVIGIATFGPSQEGVRGINFLVPISVAKEFLNELNVKPRQSRLSEIYDDGIASMNKSCYKGSLEKFKEISDLSPGFPFVQDKITQSRNAIDQGLDHCWMPSPTYIVGAVALVLILLTAVFLLMRRRSPVAELAGAGSVAVAVPVFEQKGLPELPPAVAQSFGSVQGMSGPVAGKRFQVTKEGLLIGRDATKCQIVINDDAVSKEHAWIVPLNDGTVLIDRNSTNGTFLNSPDSPKINKVKLNNGDRIFLGKSSASFTYYSS